MQSVANLFKIRMNNKEVADSCIVENLKSMEAAILGCVTLHSPKQNNSFQQQHSFVLSILTLFSFLLILLLKLVYFEKICTVSNENGDFIGLQKFTGS